MVPFGHCPHPILTLGIYLTPYFDWIPGLGCGFLGRDNSGSRRIVVVAAATEFGGGESLRAVNNVGSIAIALLLIPSSPRARIAVVAISIYASFVSRIYRLKL